MKLLVTGAAGFIGSTYVRVALVTRPADEVVVLDKLTYAGRRENLADLDGPHRVRRGRDRGPEAVREAMQGCDAVVNFAAETPRGPLDRRPDAFARTHVIGTSVLLDAARERASRYVQVSTDEVYGSIEEGSFSERSPLDPSSPYSATRPPATCSSRAYFHTYGTETVICRGSNNYGPVQYPEKLIPLMVLNALQGDSLPVYGDGMQVRNWLYVEDFARAIGTVLVKGVPGEAYNVGGPDEVREPRCGALDRRAHGPRRVADRVRDRPPRPRPPLFALVRQGGRARLGGAGPLRGGPRRGPWSGTATASGGGARSAAASTATTTSASTAARSARPSPRSRPRAPCSPRAPR